MDRAVLRGAAFLALSVMVAAGCSRSDDDGRDDGEPSGDDSDDGSQARPAEGPSYPMDWFEDDYEGALAAAQAENKPVVVAMWAPWCPTCMSMHNTVLPDSGFEPLADRFVWLKINTELDENAPVLETLRIEVWPTSYVLSPDGSVQARLTSAASVDQFRDFLVEGERAHIDAAMEAGELADDSPLAHARRGDRALSRDAFSEAWDAYELALARAPEDWTRRPDVLVSYMHAAMRAGNAHDCADIAHDHMGDTGVSTSAVRFGRYALWCAQGQIDPAAKRDLLELTDDRLAEILAGDHQLSIDDQSTALRTRRRIYDELGEGEKAREVTHRQRDLLDRAAAEAPSPHFAVAYTAHRAGAYAYLGEPETVLPDLVELAEAMPDHYDPSYWVAWLYREAGELEAAATWASRAEELAYGPRKVVVLELLIETKSEAGDGAGEREALARLIDHLEALPPAHARPDSLQRAKTRLDAISALGY